MSNGENWRSYVRNDQEQEIEKYLEELHYPIATRISATSFLEDTDFNQPPKPIWYRLHHILDTEKKWTAKLIAWGLNITATDFVEMQNVLTNFEAVQHSNRSQREMVRLSKSRYEPIYEDVERRCRAMKPRFHRVGHPERLWFKHAIMQISTRCELAAKDLLLRGHYDRETGGLTEKGGVLWEQRLTEAAQPGTLQSTATVSDKRIASTESGPGSSKRRKSDFPPTPKQNMSCRQIKAENP